MSSNPKDLTTMTTKMTPLTSDNWFKWKFEMDMILGMGGLDDIVYGQEEIPKDDKQEEKKKWLKMDKFARGLIYFQISPDYQPMFQSHTTSHQLWTALKKKFEASTMSSRIEARRVFYTTTQDPSKPVEFYIQALKNARTHLQAMGQTITDQEHKDILLMNLHSDFYSVRTSLMSQNPEPSIEQVESVLNSSPIEATTSIKMESIFAANHRSHGGGGRDRQDCPMDERGYRWCDTGRSNACHRCGRAGHVAHLCIGDMPKNVKDWVFGRHHSAQIVEETEVVHSASLYPSSPSHGYLLI